MNYPNLFIPGAPKSGTTTVYSYLENFSEIFVPNMKEPHYWARLTPDQDRKRHIKFIDKESRYLDLYANSEYAKYRLDGSTSYLYSRQAIESICRAVQSPKFIVVLRDPVSRAFSHFQMDSRIGFENEAEFVRAVEKDLARGEKRYGENGAGYVEFGLYFKHLNRLFEIVGGESVLVLFFEELAEDRGRFFARIDAFLGIDGKGVDTDIHSNKAVSVRFPTLYRYLYGIAGPSVRNRMPEGLKAFARRLLSSDKPGAASERPCSDGEVALNRYFAADVACLYELLEGYGIEVPLKYWSDYVL